MQKNRTSAAGESGREPAPPPADALTTGRLLRLEQMFSPFADDELMQGLRRLAVKCAREGLIRA